MNPVPRQIVVLGAPGTGASTLRTQLRQALSDQPGLSLSEETLPGSTHSFALLMGLDLPDKGQTERATQARIDGQLRMKEKVVYLLANDLPLVNMTFIL